MYKNGLVVSLKVDGEVLREHSCNVRIPYGSEYEIFIKNITSEAALVDIWIDGKSVLNDKSVIVNGKSTKTIKAWHTGHALKFIKLTQQIKDFRGIDSDDGCLRVCWRYAKKKLVLPEPQKEYVPYPMPYPYISRNDRWVPRTPNPTPWYEPIWCGRGTSDVQHLQYGHISACCVNDVDGITTNGQFVKQSVNTTYGFEHEWEDVTHTIELVMRGKYVQKALKVNTPLICSVCGTKSKSSAKFCSQCGTNLIG